MAIIAVANHKGGVGKTTTSHALACKIQSLEAPLFVVDLDDNESISELNDRRKANGFREFSIYRPKSYKELYRFCEEAKGHTNIVIDVGGYDAAIARVAIALSDKIITPTLSGITDAKGLDSFAKTLRNIGAELESHVKSLVLLNNIKTKKLDLIKSKISENNDVYCLADTIIKSRNDYIACSALGLGITETAVKRTQNAKNEMNQALKEILSGVELLL